MEVTGRIERVESKESSNGGLATVVYLEGLRKAFYDWDGKADGLAAGQTVRIQYSGDKFARISSIEKAGNGPAAEAGQASGNRANDRDVCIVRQCCVKAAALALQTADVPLDDKAGLILHLAAEMEQWILRPG